MILHDAERDKAKLDLSFAHIVAPISGVVTQRSVEPGNHVAPGEQLLMLVDVSHLWVTADFKETQLQQDASRLPGRDPCRRSRPLL